MPGLLVGAALVFVILLGGTEAGVFLLPFQIADALLAALLIGVFIVQVRRESDTVDLLVVGGLLAFLFSCVLSGYPRQSYDAALGALTWTASFGVGRRLLLTPRYRELLLRLLALCGFLLALAFAVLWGSVWVQWTSLTGTVPPVDLALPAYIYRHYYVVAMLLAALTPASVYLLRHQLFRMPAILTLGITAVLCVMSGSRIVWLALLVGVAASAVVAKPMRRSVVYGGLAAGAGLLLLLATGVGFSLVDRLVAGETLGYRIDIWRQASAIWAQSPLVGIGPGAIGIGLALSDLPATYDFINRHADNALVQLAAEGGLVAMAGAAVSLFAVFRGRRLDLQGGAVALIGLIVIAALTLANNPTDSPNLVAISVAYASLLAPFQPGRTPRAVATGRDRMTALGTWAAASVVASSVVLTSAASFAQNEARTSVNRGMMAAAVSEMRLATFLDPAMAMYHRDLGILLMPSFPVSASTELARAIDLNPADAAAARAMAILRYELGDQDGAATEASRAAGLGPLEPENWLTVAMVANGPARNHAAAQALHLAPWLPGSEAWSDRATAGMAVRTLIAERSAGTWFVSRDPIDSAWLAAITSAVTPRSDAATRELDLVLHCQLDAARSEYRQLGVDWTKSSSSIVATAMLARLTGDPDPATTARIIGMRRGDLGAAAAGDANPYSLFVDLTADPQLYRRLGLGPAIGGPVVSRSLDALGSWMSTPAAAAARAQSSFDLGTCAP